MRKAWPSMTGTWEQRFGARRRAIDRKILAEAEREISAQERATLPPDARLTTKAIQTPPDPARLDQAARTAIALAFGRPLT
jgi:hypothetical protein